MPGEDYTISVTNSDDESTIICLSGNLTIENSESIHDYLIRKALSPNKVTIKIENSDSVDLSILQLIIGLITERKNSKKQTNTEFIIEDSMFELLAKAGLGSVISMKNKTTSNE
ncbi:MAG: hypothetical protein QM503_13165 [Bacteroidota bacterium]